MSPRRIMLARAIAIFADLIQIFLFPLFMWGDASPFDLGLDIIVAIILISLVGWHIAFLPTFLIEGLPFADVAPTWTIAVFIATRGKKTVQSRVVESKPLNQPDPPA